MPLKSNVVRNKPLVLRKSILKKTIGSKLKQTGKKVSFAKSNIFSDGIHTSKMKMKRSVRTKVHHEPINETHPKGNKTKGWKKEAPKNPSDREKLKEECGNKCFLEPSENKYPICAKCSNSKCTCKIDCRGSESAYIRAKQYGNENVAKKARKILDTKCK